MKSFRLAGGRARGAISGEFVLVGIERASGPDAKALLATEGEWGLEFAGRAAIDLPEADLVRFWRAVDPLRCDYPHLQADSPGAQWLRPELRIRIGTSPE